MILAYSGNSHNGISEKQTTSVLRAMDNDHATARQIIPENGLKPHLLFDFGVWIEYVIVYFNILEYSTVQLYINIEVSYIIQVAACLLRTCYLYQKLITLTLSSHTS